MPARSVLKSCSERYHVKKFKRKKGKSDKRIGKKKKKKKRKRKTLTKLVCCLAVLHHQLGDVPTSTPGLFDGRSSNIGQRDSLDLKRAQCYLCGLSPRSSQAHLSIYSPHQLVGCDKRMHLGVVAAVVAGPFDIATGNLSNLIFLVFLAMRQIDNGGSAVQRPIVRQVRTEASVRKSPGAGICVVE